MSFIFRFYHIENEELIKKCNEIRQRAEKIPSITPGDMVALPAVSLELGLRSLNKPFDYEDIFKRSMIENKQRYMNLVIKVGTLLSINITPSLDSVMEKFGGNRYKEEVIRMAEEYRKKRTENTKGVHKFPSYLEIVMLYLLLRKEGNTLSREALCSFCYILPDSLDNTINSVEAVFPDYRYRDPKEVIQEKKKQLEKEREIRFQVIDNKVDPSCPKEAVQDAEKYKTWRDSVLSKPKKSHVTEKKKSCKQATISSLFCKKA